MYYVIDDGDVATEDKGSVSVTSVEIQIDGKQTGVDEEEVRDDGGGTIDEEVSTTEALNHDKVSVNTDCSFDVNEQTGGDRLQEKFPSDNERDDVEDKSVGDKIVEVDEKGTELATSVNLANEEASDAVNDNDNDGEYLSTSVFVDKFAFLGILLTGEVHLTHY